MVTDEERRKVAANLRDSAGNGEVLRDTFLEEILAGDTGLWFAEDIEIDTLLYHLADLIDPDDGQFRDATKAVDRDALLALAEEMDAYTRCSDDDRCGKQMPPLVIHEFARRIRKALGVTDEN